MSIDKDSQFHGTTILCVRKNGKVAIGGDGQVTLGHTVMKHNAKKIRTMYNENVLAGFAGATADAFTLFEKFEGKIETYRGNITRSAVELAKEWRTDKILRRLEALIKTIPLSSPAPEMCWSLKTVLQQSALEAPMHRRLQRH